MINDIIKLLDKLIIDNTCITDISKGWGDKGYTICFSYNDDHCVLGINPTCFEFMHSKGARIVIPRKKDRKDCELLYKAEILYNKVQDDTLEFFKKVAND